MVWPLSGLSPCDCGIRHSRVCIVVLVYYTHGNSSGRGLVHRILRANGHHARADVRRHLHGLHSRSWCRLSGGWHRFCCSSCQMGSRAVDVLVLVKTIHVPACCWSSILSAGWILGRSLQTTGSRLGLPLGWVVKCGRLVFTPLAGCCNKTLSQTLRQ